MKRGNTTKVRYYRVRYHNYNTKFFLAESPELAALEWLFEVLDESFYYANSYVSNKVYDILRKNGFAPPDIENDQGWIQSSCSSLDEEGTVIGLYRYEDKERQKLLCKVKVKEASYEDPYEFL